MSDMDGYLVPSDDEGYSAGGAGYSASAYEDSSPVKVSRGDYLSKREEELRRLDEEIERRRERVTSDVEAVKQRQVDTFDQPLSARSSGAVRSPPRSPARSDVDLYSPGRPRSSYTTESRRSENLTSSYQSNPMPEDISIQDENQPDEENIMRRAAEQMGHDAQLRIQKAKMKVLEDELNKIRHELLAKDDKMRAAETKAKQVTEEKNKVARTAATAQKEAERLRRQLDEAGSRAEAAERERASLKKELESLQKSHRAADSEHHGKDVRLNRALDEVERYKNMVKDARDREKDINENARKQSEKLVAENKKLQQQKQELLSAFKKQLKLIDVLKRQKIHIEAAKLLSFTEEEFTRTLELGEKM